MTRNWQLEIGVENVISVTKLGQLLVKLEKKTKKRSPKQNKEKTRTSARCLNLNMLIVIIGLFFSLLLRWFKWFVRCTLTTRLEYKPFKTYHPMFAYYSCLHVGFDENATAGPTSIRYYLCMKYIYMLIILQIFYFSVDGKSSYWCSWCKQGKTTSVNFDLIALGRESSKRVKTRTPPSF